MRIQNIALEEKDVMWPKFNPTQWEFIKSRAPFICLSGGFGSGKTTALVWRIIFLLIDSPIFGNMKGNVGLTGRLRMADFEKTTLPELLRWMPRKWIERIWKKDGILEMVNGSLLHFTHFDSIEHLQSYNIGFAAPDQMEQIDERVFRAVAYERIRLKTLIRLNDNGNLIVPKFNEDGICTSPDPEVQSAVNNYQCVFGACNPRPGWIKRKFVANQQLLESPIEQIRNKYNPDYHLILSSTYENQANLPKDYIERQRRDKSSRDFARSVDGVWDSFEGQVFCDFSDDLILDKNKIPHPSWELFVGIDHGGTGYDETRATGVTSVTFGAKKPVVGGWNKIHVFCEVDLQGSTIENTVNEIAYALKALKTMWKFHYPECNLTDYEYPEVKAWRIGNDAYRGIQDANESIAERYMRFAALIGLKMPLAAAGIDERERIERVNWLFRKSLAMINPKCEHYIEAHRIVEYGKNEKIKLMQDDHATESGGFMMSALPMWHQQFEIPEQEMSLVDRELAGMQESVFSDDVYGGRYATA